MLDLEARVGLDERVAARRARRAPLARVEIDQELERAEAQVPRRLRHAHRVVEQPLAQRSVEPRRRRALDQLLMPALERAVALAEVAHGAAAVADDLHLDVARATDDALDVEVAVAERGRGLGAAARVGLVQLVDAADDPHAAPAAAGDRLDHHRSRRRAPSERGTRAPPRR